MTRHHAPTREQRIALAVVAVVLAAGYWAGVIAYTFGGAW